MVQPIQDTLILLVEDEFLIQDLVRMTLQDAGYRVLAVDNGADGLAALEREAGGFGGLVTDINLGPQHSGWKVAACGRQLNPTLPVVYISGDSAHEWAAQGVPHSIMISKPFAANEVLVALAGLRKREEPSIAG